MPITDAMAKQAKADLLNGIHQEGDEYCIALLQPMTIQLFDEDYDLYQLGAGGEEVETGGGYVQGGRELKGRTVELEGSAAALAFGDVTWADSTITAAGAVIYNATRGNKVLAVFQLRGSDGAPATFISTNGDFTVSIPRSGTGILRIN